jgi:hypothetical protein
MRYPALLDKHAAGRRAFRRGRGVIKHGTLRTATGATLYFSCLLGVYAIDWKVVLEKLAKWLGLIGCFGQAASTTAKWQSAVPLPELEVLRQFSGMSTGQTIVDTLDLAASLTTGTYPLSHVNTTDFAKSKKVDVDTALLEKVQSEEVKEAKENEAREGVQKQIEEANLIGSEAKKRAKERAKELKKERKGVKVEARRRRRRRS